ncbi:MAG: signal peptidase II [Ignavibacteriales bacterium CG12_big_fil_rev_8_21_14_0_65_30_8]|nr:MAG: signal peptidase II [Ignavibacteriales bacterium CG12_big_fil_rev_8_21_14_0_65_30_8]
MRILFVSFFVILIDQVSKLLVKGFSFPIINFHHNGMYEGERIRILGDFFRITFIENPGMAFGIDPGSNFKFWISIFSILASIGIIIYMYLMKKEKFTLRFSLALILGGAIGNLIDRLFYGIFYGYGPLFYGRVVDFLDVDFFHFTLFGKTFDRWPIFNVADAAVSIGVIILLIFHTKTSEKKQTDLSEENTAPIFIDNETKENISST